MGLSVPVPASGAGSPGSCLAAAVAFLSEEASLCRLLTLPVCNTHYQNDRVFSLITHYFYAERRFLTKGKNNSNNISMEQLTHSHSVLLFVQNSPMYKVTV